MTISAQKPLNPEYPVYPQTTGEHIRKKRLDLKLYQKDVAKILGVQTATVWNWEKGGREPDLRWIPQIISFLGYIPFSIGGSQAEQLLAYRKIRGITKDKLAVEWDADITTLMRWERGMKPQKIKHRKLVDKAADRLIKELDLIVYSMVQDAQ